MLTLTPLYPFTHRVPVRHPHQAGEKPVSLHNINPATTTVLELMNKVKALDEKPLDKQVLTFTSSEAELPDLAAMTPEERTAEHDKQRALVPPIIHAGEQVFFDKTREIRNPNNLVIDDVAKNCDGHPSMWTEDKVKEVAEKAGSWGDRDPLDILGDGPNAFDTTVGNDDSFAKVGYAKSELGTWEPPVPEATVEAFTAEVQASVAEVEAVVSSSLGHLIRLLKIEAAMKEFDKAEEEKKKRMELARRGKSGGYLASNDQKDDDVDVAGGALIPASNTHTTRSILDRIMNPEVELRPTTLHTRVLNFKDATEAQPMRSKDHELVVRTSGEFLDRVKSIGGIIIRDHFKPITDRVFQPVDMGGIAGGKLTSSFRWCTRRDCTRTYTSTTQYHEVGMQPWRSCVLVYSLTCRVSLLYLRHQVYCRRTTLQGRKSGGGPVSFVV